MRASRAPPRQRRRPTPRNVSPLPNGFLRALATPLLLSFASAKTAGYVTSALGTGMLFGSVFAARVVCSSGGFTRLLRYDALVAVAMLGVALALARAERRARLPVSIRPRRHACRGSGAVADARRSRGAGPRVRAAPADHLRRAAGQLCTRGPAGGLRVRAAGAQRCLPRLAAQRAFGRRPGPRHGALARLRWRFRIPDPTPESVFTGAAGDGGE